MKEWFVASSLVVAGGFSYVGGIFDRPDLVRTVEAPPSEVFEVFEVLLGEGSQGFYSAELSQASLAVSNDDISYDIKSESGKYIDYKLKVQDKPFINVKVKFAPAENGAKTKVEAEYEMYDVPGGGAHLPLADMPGGKVAFNAAMGMFMNALMSNIEGGKSSEIVRLGEIMESGRRDADARGTASRWERQKAMDDAAAPTLDLNDSTSRPYGSSAKPMLDVSR